jgi:hypothetical protein
LDIFQIITTNSSNHPFPFRAMVITSLAPDHTLPLPLHSITAITPANSFPKAKKITKKPISTSDAKKLYALYAKNIDVEHLQVTFNDAQPLEVHGACRSVSSKYGVSLHCLTMRTTDNKNKVWVYRGRGTKYLQDTFDIDEPTKEEFLRVMLERATGVDVNGNKVEIVE